MKSNIKYLAFFTLLIFMSCNKDDSDTTDQSPNSTYIIVNNGNGGVNSINDTADESSPYVVQAVPGVNNGTFSNTLPILLFFDDKLYLPSLEDNIEVTQDGQIVGGIITINEGANGYAVMTFSPSQTFDVDTSIAFTLAAGVQDDGGNSFLEDYTLTFNTKQGSTGDFDSNTGFENGTQGVEFVGDGNIMNGSQGCVSPVDGNSFAAISTGQALLSNENAIGDASSLMILGPINNSFSSLNFNYNFLSSEFQEYVDSEFDDSVILTVVGPSGAHSEFLTSVNTVGMNNQDCSNFPGLPDDGDEYAGATGWISKTISSGNVGSPAYIIITITDVGDTAYSSVMAVDAFNL